MPMSRLTEAELIHSHLRLLLAGDIFFERIPFRLGFEEMAAHGYVDGSVRDVEKEVAKEQRSIGALSTNHKETLRF